MSVTCYIKYHELVLMKKDKKNKEFYIQFGMLASEST